MTVTGRLALKLQIHVESHKIQHLDQFYGNVIKKNKQKKFALYQAKIYFVVPQGLSAMSV